MLYKKSKVTFILFLLLFFSYGVEAQFDSVHIVHGNIEKVEIVRLNNGTDLLKGLNTAVEELNIKNALILSGIGSVSDYSFHVVSSRELPPSNEMSQASAAMDIVSMQGYVLNGRVHCHISFADENSMVGGHLEPETRTLTFAIITLGILPDNMSIDKLDKYKKNDFKNNN